MKTWVKDVVREGRTFRLTFYKDSISRVIWHCLGEEIYRKKKNIFDFTWKKQVFEVCCLSGDVIIDEALAKIQDMLDDEKKVNKEIELLDEFVKEGK